MFPFQLARGRWVAIVMTQVVERHITRNFKDIFPHGDNLADEEILKILEENPKHKKERKGLEKKAEEISELLRVLEEEGFASS